MKTGHRVATAWINSLQAQEVAEFYICGHSVKETAEKFGVSTVQVNNLAKKFRLTNGIPRFGKNHEANQLAMAKEAERRLHESLLHMGFDYLGGYENKHGCVRIRCRSCGAEFERTVDFLRKGRAVCKDCQKRETKRRREAEAKAKAEQTESKRLTDEIARLWYPARSSYDKQHESYLSRGGVCEICGKPYTVRDYVLSCGAKKASDNGVCSAECRDEKKRRAVRLSHKGRMDSHRHRAKKYGCEYDPSVTLRRLVKRNGLRCAICGKDCDPGDHSWSEHSGPLCPSIDHIIPMSKGGGHVWDNVQVAHIICNSEKGDRMEVMNE